MRAHEQIVSFPIDVTDDLPRKFSPSAMQYWREVPSVTGFAKYTEAALLPFNQAGEVAVGYSVLDVVWID